MVLSFLYEAIGNLLGEQKPPEFFGDPVDFEPGVLLDSGISWIYTFRKLLIPITTRNARKCPTGYCKEYIKVVEEPPIDKSKCCCKIEKSCKQNLK